MAVEVKVEVGQYHLDRSAFLDVRITDMGAVISVCDVDLNVRYTALIDKGVLLLGEVDELVREHTVEDLAAAEAAEQSVITKPKDGCGGRCENCECGHEDDGSTESVSSVELE